MRGAALIAALAALLGCGADATTASLTGADASSTSLTITFWPDGSKENVKTTATLRCNPVGGTLARRDGACRKLATLRNPFAPPSEDVMCTQQYGGPQRALISGTHKGRRVSARLSLVDGCEIARFVRLGFLVPGFTPGGFGA